MSGGFVAIEIGLYVKTITKHEGTIRSIKVMNEQTVVVIVQADNSCYCCPAEMIEGYNDE